MGQKPVGKPVRGKPFTGKDDPRRNNTIPGPGRTPDAWKAICRDIVSRDAVLDKAKAVAEDPGHPAWLGALKFLAEHGFGKPNQTIETTVTERRVIVENGPNLSK